MRRKQRKRKPKKLSLKKLKEKLNDQSLRIKQVSREVFKDADIGTRRHKNKKRYNRKPKYKKRWDENDE
jgi:hypothetical protein